MDHRDDYSFLPFFFQEPIYVIPEPLPFRPASPDPPNEGKETPTVDKIPMLGENRKHILVLVDESEEALISSADESLLINILNAVDLSVNDIALVNLQRISVAPGFLPQMLENIPFHTLISFGPLVKDWAVSNFFSKYKVSTDDASRKILLADRLKELAADPEKKRRLWLCLQQLFLG